MAEAYLQNRKSGCRRQPISRVSTLRDLYVGVPVQTGAGGLEKVLQIALTDGEKEALAVSASHVRELVEATDRILAQA
jgi:malate dehydrogenase